MDQGILTLITVGLVLAAVAAVLWLLYTVIWRAVRRGMQEFQRAQVPVPASSGADHRLREHDAEIVPDYPPREWV